MELEALDSVPSDEYTGSGSDEGSLCEEQIEEDGIRELVLVPKKKVSVLPS